jgi:hypothetical protein
MADPSVVMVLSSGRCGTQWLTATLRDICPRLEVEHEPIGPLYAPRRYFRCWAQPDVILDVPEVGAHVRDLESRDGPYVETGWPLFAALPLLARRLGPRLRILHLTRHPVPSALSHQAHKAYAGSPRDDAYTRLATLAPRDARVFQPDYAERWDALTPYEKCLFWWTEVHRFGLEFAELSGPIPFLRVRSEEMLAGDRDTLRAIVDFVGLSWDERWLELTGRRVDRWHHHSDDEIDPLLVMEHPLTLEVARELGYRAQDVDVAQLDARYRGEPDPGLDRFEHFARDGSAPAGRGASR